MDRTNTPGVDFNLIFNDFLCLVFLIYCISDPVLPLCGVIVSVSVSLKKTGTDWRP